MIALLGCGAIGSHIGSALAHLDTQFILVDDDVIEEYNLPTTAYYRHQVGANKAIALANLMWRKGGATAVAHTRTFTGMHILKDVSLVLDCFDNVATRGLTCRLSIPTLHIGVSPERTGAIVWDKDYRLPVGTPRGQEQFCTHQVGSRIIRFTAVVAAGIVEQYIQTGRQANAWTTEESVLW
jgi:hypothetical protein